MSLKASLKLAALAAVTIATAGITPAAPAAATVEPKCTHTLDWYKNRYEVVATENITCNAAMYSVTARLQLTSPKKVYYNTVCEPARNCSASTYTSNPAGSQRFCATAFGRYAWDYLDFQNQRDIPPVSSCINA
jgi:hypothetical protein